jgi:hypothetical protein
MLPVIYFFCRTPQLSAQCTFMLLQIDTVVKYDYVRRKWPHPRDARHTAKRLTGGKRNYDNWQICVQSDFMGEMIAFQ